MSKRNRSLTNKKIENWIDEGRGTGEGIDYKPWLTIRDVPSKGMVTRSKGWKTSRIHHFLSNIELHYFFTLEWSENVMDIKEQYPLLPLERTLEIADSLGIEHPKDPKTKEPIVMTTDFLISLKTPKGKQIVTRTIKPASELKERVLQKLAIEQQFYREQKIDWGIVTEKDRSLNFTRNMDWIHDAKYLENLPGLNDHIINTVSTTLYRSINETNNSLSIVALECDERFGFSHGTCLFIVKYMIANKRWSVDMFKKIDPLYKISLSILTNNNKFINEE